jgi:hypothetical protein
LCEAITRPRKRRASVSEQQRQLRDAEKYDVARQLDLTHLKLCELIAISFESGRLRIETSDLVERCARVLWQD